MKSMREAKRIAVSRRLDRARLATFVLAVVALAVLSPACDGDDNGGGTSTTPCLQFEGSGVPGAITVIAVDGQPDDDECNLLYVDLMVHDVQDLFAANIIVNFPSNVVGFSSADGAGSVLGSDNVAPRVQADLTDLGEATVAITRLAQTGVDVPDDGVGKRLIRLVFFRSASSGSGTLEFSTQQLLDSSEPPQEIPDSVWTGGTIGIVQL
jgi:hypothetical protein